MSRKRVWLACSCPRLQEESLAISNLWKLLQILGLWAHHSCPPHHPLVFSSVLHGSCIGPQPLDLRPLPILNDVAIIMNQFLKASVLMDMHLVETVFTPWQREKSGKDFSHINQSHPNFDPFPQTPKIPHRETKYHRNCEPDSQGFSFPCSVVYVSESEGRTELEDPLAEKTWLYVQTCCS